MRYLEMKSCTRIDDVANTKIQKKLYSLINIFKDVNRLFFSKQPFQCLFAQFCSTGFYHHSVRMYADKQTLYFIIVDI